LSDRDNPFSSVADAITACIVYSRPLITQAASPLIVLTPVESRNVSSADMIPKIPPFLPSSPFGLSRSTAATLEPGLRFASKEPGINHESRRVLAASGARDILMR
jgi:hypothetical protein